MDPAARHRPILDPARIVALLEDRLGAPVAALRPVGHGAISRAYAFDSASRGYVVRFSDADVGMGYEPDRLAAQLFGAPDLPIPAIVEIGRVDGHQYAISERAPGVPLLELTYDQRTALIPAIVATLDRIHRADVSGTTGFGWIGPDGNGLFATWRAYLGSIEDETRPGFWQGWRRLFDETFLEPAVWERAHAWMTALLPRCPETRHLLHGDFSGTNVLSDGQRITAVIDWAASRYGDFLFDVAYQDWQSPARCYREHFRALYAARDQDVPDFDARVDCYCSWIGLDSLRFCAHTGQADQYAQAKQRLLALIEADPPE
jgi:hygromycin-B 4-O-kinase